MKAINYLLTAGSLLVDVGVCLDGIIPRDQFKNCYH